MLYNNKVYFKISFILLLIILPTPRVRQFSNAWMHAPNNEGHCLSSYISSCPIGRTRAKTLYMVNRYSHMNKKVE